MATQTAQPKTRQISTQRLMLHLEGMIVFISCIALYAQFGGSWWLFVGLLLAPDLAFLAYALDQALGIHVYNLVHTYSAPLIMGMIALVIGSHLGISLALIWGAHIGMDRTVGYGLKYLTAFKETHLQRA